MSMHSGPSPTPPSNKGECQECVVKRRAGHRNARKPKYCLKHQCPYKDTASEEVCTIRKKAAEDRCRTHTQCKVRGCHGPRAGILNDYCEDHTCMVVDCDEGRAHDPTRGVYDKLCATHLSEVCKIPDCIGWKIQPGHYCEQHTCEVEECDQKNLSERGRPFCVEHNKCTITSCQKPKCEFGSEFEDVCLDHYIPPCQVGSCTQDSIPSTEYCNLHSCRYTDQKRCVNEARPGRGKPFCVDHKCSDHDCQALRSFNEVKGSLKMNDFCPQHECREKTCVKHNVPDKSYCNSHCCTEQDCLSARDHDTRCGTLCYTHHQERAVEERLTEFRLKEEEASNARAEEARRQARRREELLDRERQERRQPTADTGRRPEPRRPARSPPRQHYGREEELRPRQGQASDNEHADEGYRSLRNSGESFVVKDGW